MIADEFKQLALKLPDAQVGSHMKHPDFRVSGKVFATLGYPDVNWAVVMLTPDEQAKVVGREPDIFKPASGKWGRDGCTQARLEKLDEPMAREVLQKAWERAALRRL